MTISPPVNNFSSSNQVSSSAFTKARREQDEARAKDFARTPEGQAAAIVQQEAHEAYCKRMREDFSDYAWAQVDSDEREPNSAHSKKHLKNHQKNPPKKSTGFFAGLMSKLKK